MANERRSGADIGSAPPPNAKPKTETDHPLERLVFFSDAIFAIAITLLVIGIQIPDLTKGASVAQYRQQLQELIPSFFGFFMSFGVIAAFWATHHSAFSLLERYSKRILPWNLLLLGMIVLTPWTTGFLSRNLNELIPTAVYFGAFTITALLNLRTVFVATETAALDSDIGSEVLRIRRRCFGLAAGAATALCLSFLLPEQQRFLGFLAVPVWTRLLVGRLPQSRPLASRSASASGKTGN